MSGTVAQQVPLSMEFSRQEYWSVFPFPSLGDLTDPGIESGFPALQVHSLPSASPGSPLRNRPKLPNCHRWQLPFRLPAAAVNSERMTLAADTLPAPGY